MNEEEIKKRIALANQMGTSVSAPNEYSPITPASLAPAKPLTIAPPVVEPVTSVATLPPVEPTAAPANPISDTESLIAQLEGRNVDREANVQTAEQTRELNEINKQIALHQARSLEAEQKALETGETLGFASGEAARVGRNNAVRALELNALAQAKQGNLLLARTLAEDSITEKYKQVETDLRKKINDIKNNYDSFTAAEKKQADALLTRYNAEDAFVKDKKANEAAMKKIGETAAANGAPLSVVQEAMATGDTVKANAMLAKYVGTKTSEMGSIPSGEEQLYSGLSSPTATAVRAEVGRFKTEPTIQNFATIQDGYNFAQSISGKTQNPSDDQALIYSLAKALDPGSVVREGEYKTAQNYSQSWVNAFGKSVTQAIAGTGFLSEIARENIKKTIKTKYESSKRSYDNLRNQYVSGLNNLTGRSDGAKFLKDYALPITEPEQEKIGDIDLTDLNFIF